MVACMKAYPKPYSNPYTNAYSSNVQPNPLCPHRRSTESFVKTFKRNYGRCNPRPNALTEINQLDSWFEDYTSSHPHRSLKMLSPHEFIKSDPKPEN